MNRKLIFLNVALVLVVGYAGVLFRNQVRAARVRSAAMAATHSVLEPVPALAPLAEQPAVVAARYQEIPIKTLFHPSRTSELPVPEKPVAPPPPPIPALPKYRGTMNLDGSPIALLAMGSGPSQEVRAGEGIGPFTLVDFNTVDMTFECQGEIARRTLDQLTDHSAPAANRDDVRSAPSMPATVTAPVVTAPLGPGPRLRDGGAECQPNDSMPYGTVVQGLRKVQVPTPFAPACRWDPIGR